jgi:hypothetical protein
MKKFVSLGSECVKFLKVAQASKGNLLSVLCLLPVSCIFLHFFI